MFPSNSTANFDKKQLIKEDEKSSMTTLNNRFSIQFQNISDSSTSLDEILQLSDLYRKGKDGHRQDLIELDPIIKPN